MNDLLDRGLIISPGFTDPCELRISDSEIIHGIFQVEVFPPTKSRSDRS
jgi:hypothetical protein